MQIKDIRTIEEKSTKKTSSVPYPSLENAYNYPVPTREETIQKDGLALKRYPKISQTADLCMKAVKQNGLALKYVRKKLISLELCSEAIHQDPNALQFVPAEFKSIELCLEAIDKNGSALRYVEKELISFDMCWKAVQRTPSAIKFVPDKFKTTNLCNLAISKDAAVITLIPLNNQTINLFFSNFERDPLIFEFFPNELKDKSLSNIAINRDVRNLAYVPHSLLTPKLCLNALKKAKKRNLLSVFEKEHFGKLPFKIRNHSKIQHFFDKNCPEKNFYLKKSLSKPVCISDLFAPVKKTEPIFSTDKQLPSTLIDINPNVFKPSFYYISDLHLDDKILKKFPNGATTEQKTEFINEVVQSMKFEVQYPNPYLIVAGDVSFDFKVCEIFYTALVNTNKYTKIFVVLGNHELWDGQPSCSFNPSNKVSANYVFEKYRLLFDKLKIVFLQNDLAVISNDSIKVIPENILTTISTTELISKTQNSLFLAFGGVGFSGYCKEHNATSGLYRNCITTLEEDLANANKFKAIYDKLSSLFNNDHMLVITHTPMDNWAKTEQYVSKWIYVNGHTHNNYFCNDTQKTVYADNQIGYTKNIYTLKSFFFKENSGTAFFNNLEDGAYKISKRQYLEFNRSKGVAISMNHIKDNETITMLKRTNLFCFFFNGYLLNGGIVRKNDNKDLDYYYENMTLYAEAVSRLLQKFNYHLSKISNEVKKIGGSGNIHGCIVDIDFDNHIFCNPADGTVTPYFAVDKGYKFVYRNVSLLLENKCPKLYENFKREHLNNTSLISHTNQIIPESSICEFVSDTSIYKVSDIIKSLQYIRETGFIRLWEDNILKTNSLDFSGEQPILLN